jgi:hypothetical protein
VLNNLEEAELSAEGKPKLAERKKKGDGSQKPEAKEAPQMYLFGGSKTKE